MRVVDRSLDQQLEIEEHASGPLAGGIVSMGYQCGMLWGGTLAAGAQAYGLLGPGPQAETAAMIASQRLVESFRARNKNINCLEITEIEWKPSSKRRFLMQIFKFFIKGGPIGCVRMTARYAPVAFSEINTALSEENIEVPAPPVSCSAMLAQKMGVSEKHTVMAAGFAGGIGLSGGACGALGAAIWIIGMNGHKEGAGKKVINSRASDLIDRFIRSADFKFECSEIVGRRFGDIGDHAGYLRDGGCAEIIEVLAAR
ncbi:C-GCAxxG-C-C family (seleno)protein [Chloroflexota bacterium]